MIFIFEKIFVRVFVYKSWKIGIEKRKKCHLWIQKITRYAYYCNDVSIFFQISYTGPHSLARRPVISLILITTAAAADTISVWWPHSKITSTENEVVHGGAAAANKAMSCSRPHGKTYLRVFLKKKIWVVERTW